MTVMCRAYLPSLEIGFVVRMLGFHQQVAAAMATTTTTMSKKKSSSAAATTAAATAITAAASKAFRKWINEVGKPYGCVLGKKEMHVETKPWLNKCFAVIEASGLKIDLKGQI